MPGKAYMAIDQNGRTWHGLVNPRKDLCRRLARSHADRMFKEMPDGTVCHVGYVIGGLWLTLYEVKPVRIPVNGTTKQSKQTRRTTDEG